MSREVSLVFLRDELLYDIKNYAYIEGHVMGEEKQHAQHTLVEIGEAGNVDRVTRLLGLCHASVVEMLYPYTKIAVDDSSMANNVLDERDAYVIEMVVPSTMSQTTIDLLRHLIHEYMVCRVVADWLSITNAAAAEHWALKAAAAAGEIEKAKNLRTKAFTRKTSPW